MQNGSRSVPHRLLAAATLLYVAAVLVAWLLLRFLGDRWSLPTVLLFGPRWVAAAPAALLLPLALAMRAPGPFAANLATAAFVIGPLMDYRVSRRALARDEAPPHDVRILTHNLDGISPTSPRMLALLDEVHPDVAAFQECIPSQDGKPLSLEGWYAHSDNQICLLSRYPITTIDGRDRTDVWNRGGSGAIVRYEIALPSGTLHLMNVHLETVREGLEGLRHLDFAEMRDNIAERGWESALAREWAKRAGGPLVVAGDFNMPIESAIYRQYWSDFDNAFSDAGLGYGTTKKTHWFGVRIDHVLMAPGWECVGAWIASPTGSDHRPLFADLRRTH